MSKIKPIYLDYAATTPLDSEVARAMCDCLMQSEAFGNPSSATHAFGWQALDLVEQAREHVAQLIHAKPEEIIWTSGATEAINLALQGVARFYRPKGQHIITAQTEHQAGLATCQYLEQQGFSVTYLPVDRAGLIDLGQLESALTPETILISIMHANNETGALQDIAAIGAMARKHKVLFHCDIVQSLGKIPINVTSLPVDLLSMSAHKIYGPKGVGALYLRQPQVKLKPLFYGGSQERSLRPGTLAVHQIVGMGEACRMAQGNERSLHSLLGSRRDQLWVGLQSLPDVHLNSAEAPRLASHLNVQILGLDKEALLSSLEPLAIALGSACNSSHVAASHVLTAMGLSSAEADLSFRFSVGKYTTEAEIDATITNLVREVTRLRELANF